VEGKIMWRRTLVTSALVAAQLHAIAIAEGSAACHFANLTTQAHMERAVRGAMRRLLEPDCQQLFSEYSDSSGAPLQAVLERKQATASGFLSQLFFVDGSETPQCQKRGDLAAYTAPGFRVIFVCGDRFARSYGTQPKAAEMLVIHETLHALGLGENPPSSEEITARVTRRCT
jgi:hypothetical protein